jgi:uncharacterized protein YndB with AHSA1/START domain
VTGPVVAGDAVEIRRVLPAEPAEVFRAWTDPALLALWMTPVGHAEATVDPRQGGTFRVVMRGDGRVIEHVGEYIVFEPPRRLVFTWRSPYTGDRPTRVTVTLDPVGADTALSLVHELLPADVVASHRSGWGRMLERLAAAVERGGSNAP